MSDFEIVTQKRSYTFNVKGYTIGFIGTEIDRDNHFHYEGHVPIFIGDEHNCVGVAYHKEHENLFSLTFMCAEAYKAILKAHKKLLKTLKKEKEQ